MTKARQTLFVASLLLVCIVVGWGLHATGLIFREPPGHVFELFASTGPMSFQRTMSFLDGDYGMVIQKGTLYNRDSHLDFGWYEKGEFRVGIQGREKGFIADLGHANDLIPGRPATDILRLARWRKGSLLVEGASLPLGLDGEANHAPIKVGHCYFALIYRGKGHPDLDVPALFIVLEHEPGMRVKIRWSLL